MGRRLRHRVDESLRFAGISSPVDSSTPAVAIPADTAAARAISVPLTFRTLRGISGLKAIRAEWNAVVRTMSRPRYFHRFPWHEAYASHLAANPADLRFIVAYRGDASLGVFPLKRGTRAIGGVTVRTLEIPEHPHIQDRDFIFEGQPSTSGLVAAMVDYLDAGTEPWDVLLTHDLLEDSAALFSIEAVCPRQTLVEEANGCDFFDDTPYETRLRGFAKSFRGGLRRARHRLAQLDGVEYVCADDTRQLSVALQQLIEVEGSGWKGREGTAIRCDSRLVAFYHALVAGFGPMGGVEINLLRLANTCIAAQLCMRGERCLDILKIGHDEGRSFLSPGNMLLEHVVKRVFDRREVDVVNLVSNAPWQSLWRPRTRRRIAAYIFNTTLRGRMSYNAMRAKDRLRPVYRRYIKPLIERERR